MLKAIVGGTVLTGTGKEIEDGIILIDGKRLVYVGKTNNLPKDTEVINATGKFVSPGFVDAHSHIGMIPEGLDWEYSDVNDYSGPVTANLRAIDAVDIHDPAFRDAVEGGVTTVYTGPGSANVIGGVGLIMKTAGANLKEMVLASSAAIKMALGPKRKSEYAGKAPYPTTRMGTVALLRDKLSKAKALNEGKLDTGKLEFEEKETLKLLAKALRQEISVKIHLSTSPDEICAALRIIDEFSLKATIDHVFGGQLVADEISKSGVPVVYGPPMIAKLYSAFRYVDDKAPVVMIRRGVPVSIMTDHPVIPERYLRFLAAIVVRNGATLNEALSMITINPAKALGIEKRVGSLEEGKDADVVISSAHPLMPYAVIEKVLINGKLVNSST